METKYKGTIILESLTDELLLNDFEVIGLRITSQENPADRWHLITVLATASQIEKLAAFLHPEKWYAHFWHEDDIIAIFPNKVFHFKYLIKVLGKKPLNMASQSTSPKTSLIS